MLADRTALLSTSGLHFRNCRSFIHGNRFGVLGRFRLCYSLPKVHVLRRHDQVAVADKVAEQNSTMSRRCQLQVRAENLLLKRILITLVRDVVQLIEQLLEQVAEVRLLRWRELLFERGNELRIQAAVVPFSCGADPVTQIARHPKVDLKLFSDGRLGHFLLPAISSLLHFFLDGNASILLT